MTDLPRKDWERADRLFTSALDRPLEERERFVRASGEPETIVARVLALLEAERRAEARIGESVDALAEEVVAPRGAPEPDLAPGSSLGPYRIVEELGRGGMGTVYLAEGGGDAYERRVALKVVKRGMDTDEVVARFRREGRILARLEHPGIARMYDADVSPDGRPFLVLEFVDGRPIDVHCDAERMTVDERVELFLGVCDAVSFAHGKLVLHRDLKPSNILVTTDGPRLLDFGVAKVLDEAETETRDLTALVGRRLTPEYASPEQLEGGDISTASDVYSLGVVLYELLTGRRPGSVDSRPPSRVVTDDATGPETVEFAAARGSTPHRLARRLHGDLDVILMKALHEDSRRRYASVEAFAADLLRHLEGRPVTARPDSVAYRARKFVSRNRLPVFSSSGLVLSVLFFGVASFLQQAETARERDRAEAERARAEEVADVLEDLFAGAGFESRDRIDTLRVRDFIARSAGAVMEELEGRPLVQGELLRILGGVQHAMGRLDEADSLLTRAVTVLADVSEVDPRPHLIAQRDLGHLRQRQGRFDEARTLYEAWLRGDTEMDLEEETLVHHNVGLALLGAGHLDSAALRLDSALALHRRAPEPDVLGYGRTLSMRAGVAQRSGDLALATELAREALESTREEFGADHPNTMTLEHNYAFMVFRSGRAEEALPLFEELHERWIAQVGPESAELSTLKQNYGNVLRELDRPEEALPLVREAVAIDRGRPGPAVTFSLDALGATLERLERYEDARVAYEEALDASRRIFGDEHPTTAISTLKVATGLCRSDAANRADALTQLDTAEQVIDRAFPPGHPWRADVTVRRGRCLVDLGRLTEAEPVLVAAVDALEAAGVPAGRVASARELLEEVRAGVGSGG